MSNIRPKIGTALSLQGIVFVVILAFVTVCAVLRNVNLLVVVSGTMSASLILCWRCSRKMVANIVAKRLLPEEVYANEAISIQWQVDNLRATSIFNLRIDDRVSRNDLQSQPLRGAIASKGSRRNSIGILMFEGVLPHESCLSSYRATFPSRGVYRAGPAIVSTQFPLPLIKCWFRTLQTTDIHVAPAPGQLLPGWFSQLKKNENCFENRSSQQGSNEDEFFAIRNWQAGDSLKRIHWRSTAKTRVPMVRQFESHSPDAVFIAADLYADHDKMSNLLDPESESQICENILGLLATLLLQWRGNRSQHLVVGIADDESTTHVANPDSDFAMRLHQRLATVQPCRNPDICGLVEDCFANISGSEKLLIVSSRPIPDEIADHPFQSRIKWLNLDAPALANLFQYSTSVDTQKIPDTSVAGGI